MPATSPSLIGLAAAIACGSELDADFGFEAAAVHVLVAEPLCRAAGPARHGRGRLPAPEALARLIDRLQQRLGASAVRSLHPHQSHIPERAVARAPLSLSPALFSTGRGSG